MQQGAGLIPLSSDRSRVFLVQGLPTLKWGFPKGRQDPADEGDFLRTATREAVEEINLRPDQYVQTGTQITYYGYTFFEVIVADAFVPTLKKDEIANGKWFLMDELKVISKNMYLSLWWNQMRAAGAAAAAAAAAAAPAPAAPAPAAPAPAAPAPAAPAPAAPAPAAPAPAAPAPAAPAKKRSRVTFEHAHTLLEKLDHVSALLQEAEALVISIRKRYLS